MNENRFLTLPNQPSDLFTRPAKLPISATIKQPDQAVSPTLPEPSPVPQVNLEPEPPSSTNLETAETPSLIDPFTDPTPTSPELVLFYPDKNNNGMPRYAKIKNYLRDNLGKPNNLEFESTTLFALTTDKSADPITPDRFDALSDCQKEALTQWVRQPIDQSGGESFVSVRLPIRVKNQTLPIPFQHRTNEESPGTSVIDLATQYNPETKRVDLFMIEGNSNLINHLVTSGENKDTALHITKLTTDENNAISRSDLLQPFHDRLAQISSHEPLTQYGPATVDDSDITSAFRLLEQLYTPDEFPRLLTPKLPAIDSQNISPNLLSSIQEKLVDYRRNPSLESREHMITLASALAKHLVATDIPNMPTDQLTPQENLLLNSILTI